MIGVRFLFLFLVFLLLPGTCWAKDIWPTKYDAAIKSAINTYWLDWREPQVWTWGKAQLVQESHLDPSVCSGVGACGLAQFMPKSWDDQVKALGFEKTASRHDAALAIQAYAYYSAHLRVAWRPAGRANTDRNDLQLVSYNAGLGNIIKAQKRCNDAVLWVNISPCLEAVTGRKNAAETTGYVRRIHEWQAEIVR